MFGGRGDAGLTPHALAAWDPNKARLDDIWDAWARADADAELAKVAREAAEKRRVQGLKRQELAHAKRTGQWGGRDCRRQQLYLRGVPTTRFNGTYGALGAPVTLENMNLYRHTPWGGGPPLDCEAMARCRTPLRRARTPRRRFPPMGHARPRTAYAWYARGHHTPHDARRAFERSVVGHVPSSNFSDTTMDRFRDPSCFSEPSLVSVPAVRAAVGDHVVPARPAARTGRWSTTGRFRDFSSIDPKICVARPRDADRPARPETAMTAREARDRVDRDPYFHPLGPTVRGPDPADLCDATLGAYLGTLARARESAPE